MAIDLKKLESEGKTLEQIFKEAKGNVDETAAATDLLIEKVTELLNLDEERQDNLADYLSSLGEVSDSWDRINRYAEDSISFSSEFKYNIDSVRNSLSDIVSGASTIRTQTTEQLRPVRVLRDLAGEIERCLRFGEGLEKRSLDSLSKKVNKTVELYEYDVRRIANLDKDISLTNPSLETRNKLTAVKQNLENKLTSLKEQQVNSIGRERLELETLIKYYSALIEKIDVVNLKKVEGLKLSKDELLDINKQVQARTSAAGFLANLGEKFGLTGLSKKYQDSVREQTVAAFNRQAAQKSLNEAVVEQKAVAREQQNIVRSAEGREKQLTKQVLEKGPKTNKKLEDLDKESTVKKADLVKTRDSLSSLEASLDLADNAEEREDIQKQINILKGQERNLESELEQLEERRFKINKAFLDLDNKRLLAVDETDKAKRAQNTANLAAAERVNKAQDELNAAKAEETRVNRDSLAILKDIALEKIKGLSAQTVALYLATKIWQAFKGVNLEAVELKRNIGSWEIGSAAVNSRFATSIDWLKTATELVKKTGLQIEGIFTGKEIATIAEFKNLTGATAEQASNLAIRSKLAGQGADQYRDSLTKGANAGNLLNRSIVTLKEVQDGVLNASDAITLSYGNNAKELGKAVVAAKNLGMELAGVENISRKLIDFESSISSEMEAQLLTGMELNLNKAREAALNNDLEGVAREIANQGITSQKFGAMNLIQQESLAKSLGMSREELAKSLILRQLNNGASAEAVARAHNMTKEQIEAISVQDRWRVATEKLVQAFTPILEVLVELMRPISWLIQQVASFVGWVSKGMGWVFHIRQEAKGVYNRVETFGSVLQKIVGVVGVLAVGLIGVGKILSGHLGLIGKIFKASVAGGKAVVGVIGTGVRTLVSSPKKLARARHLRSIGAFGLVSTTDSGSKITNSAANSISKAADAAGKAGKTSVFGLGKLGNGIRKFFNRLGAIKWTGIVKAAAMMALLGGSLALFGVAVRTFADVEWGTVRKGLATMVVMVGAVIALGGLLSGPQMLVALEGIGVLAAMAGVMALVGLSLQTFTKPLDDLSKINWGGFSGVGKALTGLALGIGTLGLSLYSFGLLGIVKLKALTSFLSEIRNIDFSTVSTDIDTFTTSLKTLNVELRNFKPNFKLPKVHIPFVNLNRVERYIKSLSLLKNLEFLSNIEISSIRLPEVFVPNLKPVDKLIVRFSRFASLSRSIVLFTNALQRLNATLQVVNFEKLSNIGIDTSKIALSRKLAGKIRNTEEDTKKKQQSIEYIREAQTKVEPKISENVHKASKVEKRQEYIKQQTEKQNSTVDLSVVEKKLDSVIKAINSSKPEWEWLKFNTMQAVNS